MKKMSIFITVLYYGHIMPNNFGLLGYKIKFKPIFMYNKDDVIPKREANQINTRINQIRISIE